jgi:dihydrofolate reductase/thymidylate synthase
MIMASTLDMGIGLRNDLPWPRLVRDFNLLKSVTTEGNHGAGQRPNAVIYGFKTFESLRCRPLSHRRNIVITRKGTSETNKHTHPDVVFASSLEMAVDIAREDAQVQRIHVLGGSNIYNELLSDPQRYGLDTVYWTRIFEPFETDVKVGKEAFDHFIKEAPHKIVSETVVEHGDVNYDLLVASKLPITGRLPTNLRVSDEYQYLQLLEEIIRNGEERPDRTNTGIRGTFGRLMRFNLEHAFPLLTTKSVFFRGVLEELLWFLRGETNSKALSEKGVKIWDGNGSREFLDSRGLHGNCEGDLGPVYGFQWRHFGAKYEGLGTDYSGKGKDQIHALIENLKKDKYSRRHLLSAWNPADLDQMALPPCHVMSQFYITQDDRLNCALFQRSADIGLGIPFNIASYALLTSMIAHHLGLKRGEFVHFIGDAHVYLNHVSALETQAQRLPNAFPVLKISPQAHREHLWDYQTEDFVLKNYVPQAKLKMKMAV